MTYTGEGGLQDIRRRIYRERGTVTLDANGKATITLANPVAVTDTFFIHLTPWVNPNEAKIIANVTGWVTSGSNKIGFTIECDRLRSLPNPLTLITALVGFQPWLSTGAASARVDWMIY